ncbi:MAG: type II toxin-antitoxin system HicA family toxin [Proteobacteria bacterium]|nr:type II toxin-antitoxin system HicA family toxin [Betaproteobacteria bacterium]MCL1860815.1 type II toxin-antitoxin system HicA family toxin [Pseudomonadota bacterium]
MKYSEFRRYLKSLGATIQPAHGSHFKVTLNGKTTIFPFHGAKEMKKGLVEGIKKDLDIK